MPVSVSLFLSVYICALETKGGIKCTLQSLFYYLRQGQALNWELVDLLGLVSEILLMKGIELRFLCLCGKHFTV